MALQANVIANRDFAISRIDPRIYSGFLEHLGRAVYTGIYEPDHPTADEQGFRGDVLDLVRQLDVPFVRYPGGDFVSNYRWEDGVGPRENRPVKLDLAWKTIEPNQIGTNEFMDWCRKAGTAPMMAVNLGTRGLEEALTLLEYCNHPNGSHWSDLRRSHGWEQPHNVKLWCLGNEMDGPWETGHRSAAEYGSLAAQVGRAMRVFDSSLELVACGSSNPFMETYPQWEATVLEHCYDTVDYISLHMYFQNNELDPARFLARPLILDRYIQTIGGVIDYVKAKKRSKRQVHICFDEWNVWYHSPRLTREEAWEEKPRILEDEYNLEDVLQVGCILNTFLRRADRVKIACIAQLVNVIAPIMTQEGGPAWKQSIYYPLYFASRFGRGMSLRLAVDCPTYDSPDVGGVPFIDIAGVHGDDGGVVLFAINRHLEETLDLNIDLQSFPTMKVADHRRIAGGDLRRINSAHDQLSIVPETVSDSRVDGSRLTASLPPLSWQMIRLTPVN